MHSWIRVGNLLRRKELWDETVDCDVHQIVCHSVVMLNASISACEKGTQWASAIGLLPEMPRRAL